MKNNNFFPFDAFEEIPYRYKKPDLCRQSPEAVEQSGFVSWPDGIKDDPGNIFLFCLAQLHALAFVHF